MTSAKLRVLVLLFLGAFVYALPGDADSSASYGSGLGSDGLANTVVGGQWGNIVSYRFRAGHSGPLQQIHVYLIPNHVGYSAGTGGQIQVTVNADDGTSAHNPSSTILASYLLSNPLAAIPSINFPIFVFSVPPTLVQGQLYHIVFTNVDPSPTINYLSVDALYLANPSTPAQPTVSDVDAAELLCGPSGTWAPRKGYTPILELDYQDGWSEFIGYVEVWVGAPQTISGPSAVRETITVTGAQKTVSSASIRVARTSGTDPLIVLLENGDGTVIEQGEIPASSIPLTSPVSYAWATFTFSSAHALLAGQSYHLQISAASTSSYQAYPIRKGVAYGFQKTTYFPDGYAQFNQNGSWVGWTQWGVANRTDGDLQFYFSLAPGNAAAPTISNLGAGSLTSNSATITWTTDQSSTSQVEYGTTTSYSNITAVDSNSVTSHSEVLAGLTASTLYHYRVHSVNSSGVEAISGDLTLTTLAAPAPVISNVAAGSITSSAASITWSTDQATSSQVEYGTTTAYGSTTTLDQTLVTSHSQAMAGLLAARIYHYRVHSLNASGTEAISSDLTFTTLAVPAPVISNVVAGSITSNGATITWSTDQASSSQVDYGTTTDYGSMTTLDQTLVTSHSQGLAGLLAATAYHYRVRNTNASGAQGISGDFTFTTLAAPTPVISNVVAGSITSNAASITWSTDQASSSQVEYGTTTAYGSMTTLDQTLVISHSQALVGLLAVTAYHYRIRSTNASGTQGISGDFTFTTLAASAPVISNVAAGPNTSSGATITWSTDQASSSQVEYGTTTAYGGMTTLNQTLVTSHSQALTGLLAATVYHYRVHSTNAWGAQGVSADFTLTTRKPRH
jgi:hypothetical protein